MTKRQNLRSGGDTNKKPEPAWNSWHTWNWSNRKSQSETWWKGYESWHSQSADTCQEPWQDGVTLAWESHGWAAAETDADADRVVHHFAPAQDADHKTIATNTEDNTQENLGKQLWPSAEIVAAFYENREKAQDENNPCIKAGSRISSFYQSAKNCKATQIDEPVSQESWVFGLTKGNLCEKLYFRPKKLFRTTDVISVAVLIGHIADGWTRTLVLELRTDPPSVIEIDDPWTSSDHELPIGKYISVTMRNGHATNRIKSIVNSYDEDPMTKQVRGEYVLTANSRDSLDDKFEWFLTPVVDNNGEEVPCLRLPEILPSMATRFVMGKPIAKVKEMETICNDISFHKMCLNNRKFCLLIEKDRKASVYGDTPFKALDHLERMWLAEKAEKERMEKEAKNETTVADMEGLQDVEGQPVCNQQSGVPLNTDLKRRIQDAPWEVSVSVLKSGAIVHFETLTWLAQVSIAEDKTHKYYCPACNHMPLNGPLQLADHFGRKNCKMKLISQPTSSSVSERDEQDDPGWQEQHQVKATTDFEQEAHGCQPELRWESNTGSTSNGDGFNQQLVLPIPLPPPPPPLFPWWCSDAGMQSVAPHNRQPLPYHAWTEIIWGRW